MTKAKLIYLFFCLTIFSTAFSQKGKDAARTVSVANVRINEFTALTANANSGNTIINVTASALNTNARFTNTLTPGDLIMIIQMQGAFMNLNKWTVPWQPDSAYGKIWDYSKCGNHEFALVKTVISATQIELECGLDSNYSAAGKTQIVRIPRFSSLNVTGTGTLTTDAWNGTIGGVLAVEVDGNTTINGIVSANGLGFRGGVAVTNSGSGNDNFVTRNPNDGAEKGEGIGSDRLNNALAIDSLGKQCKGAPANGGGGGNANNCGGGGGANGGNINNWYGLGISNPTYSAIFNLEWTSGSRSSIISSGGGKGGYGTSTTTTANINSVPPNSTSWGSFKRPSFGGFGGRPLDYSTGKIFMGGGGGAGHKTGPTSQSNGANACSGGAGGGLIYFLNYGTISGSGTISSNGANGNNAFGSSAISVQGIDGAGGAGAGGTIILKSNGIISTITTNANGGNGGNQQINNPAATNEGQGPGGGGSGGYIASSNIGFTQNVNGGVNGTTNSTPFDTEFPMNGATSGATGTSNQTITPSYSLTASANQTLCTNQSTTVNATSTNPSATIQWFNTATGGTAVASGTVYTTPTYTATGTYTIYAASCPGIYRLPIIITVNTGATISVNSPTICPTQTVTLTASGATTYTWNTGPTTNTISVSPTSTTIYSITASAGSCNATQTATVTVSSQPTIAVTNVTICSGNSATLTATGATNYTWSPGGQTTTSIVVTPTANTTYSITGSNGTCTNSTTASVNITTTPTLSSSSRTICTGQVATFTVSGATTYTWNPGNITGSTYTTSAAASGTLSVIGANGTCTTQTTVSLTVNPSPTIAVSNQTICQTQSVTLTASGATTYTWNTGPTTNTISVSPISTTIYTVNGTTNSCVGTKTVTVTVASQPTLAVSSTSICSGSSATLTATGATNYTWAPGGQITTSIVVTPTTNTTYTITGSNGTCSNTTTATVSITTTPTLALNSVTICAGQTATLTVSGATTYTWNPGGVSGTSYTIAPASSTTVSVIGANGTCTSQATASVTIGSGISIAVNSETICAGQTASLTANGATSYTWNTGANTNTLNVSPTSTTIYTITGSNGSCNGTNTATVTVVNQPTISVANATICSGSFATLIASGATNYTWNPGSLTGTTITVSPTINTTYTITGSNSVCTNTTTSIVSVINCSSACSFNLGNDTAFCSPINYTINGPTGYDNYLWSPGGTTNQNFTATTSGTYICQANILSNDLVLNGDFSSGNTSFTSNYTVPTVPGAFGLLTNPGTYLITTSPNIAHNNFIPFGDHTTGTGNMMVCNGSAVANDIVWSQTIPVSPNTNYNFSAWVASVYNTSAGNEAQLQFSINGNLLGSTFSAPFTAGVWANFSTNWNSGISNSAVITIVDQNFTAPGANDFALDDIFYQQVCSHSDTIIITENLIPTVTASASNSVICNGNTTSLIGGGASTYTWTNGVTNGASFSPTITTTYTVTGTSVAGCTNTAIQTITVNSTPIITANNATVCSGQTATLIANGATTYTWSNNVNGNSQTVNPTSTIIFTVSGTDANGCTNNTTSTVNVNATAIADFNSSEGNIVTIGSNVNLTNTSSNADSYLWDVLCSGQTSNSNNLTIAFADTGSCCINLIANNVAGCSDTIQKCISIVKEAVVIIPNVFTPNGDGSNDVFKISFTGLKTLTCAIYDRWGLKMYEWDGLNGYWDGATKSGIATDGTYFYIVTYTDFKDKSTTEKGFLNLFKN